MASVAARGQKFFESRKVPGLQYRDFIELQFTERTRFLGEIYEPGTYSFASAAIFGRTAIEFMGPNRMSERLGFELHVRSDFAAGENLSTARALQARLTGHLDNLHLHMVTSRPQMVAEPAPLARWRRFWGFLLRTLRLRAVAAAPTERQINDAEAFRAADFVRRTMLVFELQMISRGLSISPVETGDGSGLNFFPVRPKDFVDLAASFRQGDAGPDVFSKSGTVGLRTAKYYDGQVWGVEVRYLSPNIDQGLVARTLTALQARMTSGRYFMDLNGALAYLGAHRKKGVGFRELAANLMYASDFEAKLDRWPLTRDQKALIRAAAEANDFVKMLVHDWSHDPIYADRPERLAKLLEAQKIAVKMILTGRPSPEAVLYFVKKSALAYDLQMSLALE